MDNSKSKSTLKLQLDNLEYTPNKKNTKENNFSFSEESNISNDPKENHKFFSPVNKNYIIY
jgi:hypothetical protein